MKYIVVSRDFSFEYGDKGMFRIQTREAIDDVKLMEEIEEECYGNNYIQHWILTDKDIVNLKEAVCQHVVR